MSSVELNLRDNGDLKNEDVGNVITYNNMLYKIQSKNDNTVTLVPFNQKTGGKRRKSRRSRKSRKSKRKSQKRRKTHRRRR